MALLTELRQRGVELMGDGLNLRYRGPKGVLTPELKAGMAEYKAELLAYLGSWRAETPEPQPPIVKLPAPPLVILLRATGGVRSRFPDTLPGLGSLRIRPFTDCARCGSGTWAWYGTLALCLKCARDTRPT